MWVIHKIRLQTNVGKLELQMTRHIGVGFVMILDIVLFIAKKHKITQGSSIQEKRGASGKSAAVVNNVKDEPMQCNRVVIDTRNQPGTNLIGARSAEDIPDIIIPDNSVYEAADRICEEIARRQANNADDTVLKCVITATHGSNTGDVATGETVTRLVNRVDFSITKGRVSFESECIC